MATGVLSVTIERQRVGENMKEKVGETENRIRRTNIRTSNRFWKKKKSRGNEGEPVCKGIMNESSDTGMQSQAGSPIETHQSKTTKDQDKDKI